MFTLIVALLVLGAAPMVENVPGVKQVQTAVRVAREYLSAFFKGE